MKDRVYTLSAALISLGVQIEDRVAIISSTRLEWVVAYLGIMCSGATAVPIYPTTGFDDFASILSQSDTRFVFVENAQQTEKLRSGAAPPGLIGVATFEEEETVEGWVTLQSLLAMGASVLAVSSDVVDARIDVIAPEHLALLTYQGTAAPLKGAQFTQDSVVNAGQAVASVGMLTVDDLQFLYLPLAHVFARALLTLSILVGFPTAVDGRIEKLVENMAAFRPTFTGVTPRVLEKAQEGLSRRIEREASLKKGVVDWAIHVGRRVIESRAQGREPGGLLRMRHAIADRLVLSSIRDVFGGRMRFFLCGMGQVNPETAYWFASAGLPVCEAYVVAEAGGIVATNSPTLGTLRIGTVGRATTGTSIKTTPSGEILIRSSALMKGYLNRPDKTHDAIDEEGFFHTGDMGSVDESGFVTIFREREQV